MLNRKKVSFVLSALMVVIVSGCGIVKPVNKDVVTAEEEVKVEPAIQVQGRDWPVRTVYYQNGSVSHKQLYLEGYFEQRGSWDDEFHSWGTDDMAAIGVGPAFFLGNVIVLPLTMVERPPCQQQESRSGFPLQEPAYELAYEPACIEQ